MLNLDNFSDENLKKIQRVLKIILDAWELIEPKEFVHIPFEKIEASGLSNFWPIAKKVGAEEKESLVVKQEYRGGPGSEKRGLEVWVKNDTKLKELYGEIGKRLEKVQPKKKNLRFDSLNGAFHYGNEVYKVRSEKRLVLARKLWEEHKETEKETKKMLKKGLPFPKDALLRNIEVVSTLKKLKEEIKALNRGFRSHRLPAKITMKGGVQLIVEV